MCLDERSGEVQEIQTTSYGVSQYCSLLLNY